MTLDLTCLAPHLERRADGIWFAPQQAPVSYPAEGNAACLQVEDRSFWFRHRNRCISSVVRRHLLKGTLFDIGGGNGYVAKGLMQAGIPCALVEPGIDGALAARARGIDPVICARLEDIGLAPASVAAAGMFDVLEHIEDEGAALREVHALLQVGGRVFLTVPAYNFLQSEDDVAAGHFRRYSLTSLSRALLCAGFTTEFATYMFAPLPPLIFLRRPVPSWLGLRQISNAECQAGELAPDGPATRLIDRMLKVEALRIEAGRAIPFGSSCLIVAVRD
jgi:SAM-dependent methyltransferase